MKTRIGVLAGVALLAAFAIARAEPIQAPQFFGAIGYAVTNTGTTDITAATVPAVSGKTNFLCGFSVRSNATGAATGTITITGLKASNLVFRHFTAPLASGLGVTEPPLGSACLPASGQNTAITIAGPAPGSGGNISVSAWGFYQ